MFVTAEAAAQLTAAASGNGMTMAAMPMIDAINQNSAVLAGFLLMSVPVLAGGMARGAMSLANSAGAMLAPVQHGVDAAAAERTTGNYSYGNVTANQWNTAATHRDGAGISSFVAANGTEFARSADGSVIYNNTPGISRLGFTPSEVEGAMRNVSDSAARYHNQATSYRQAASETYSAGLSRVHGLTRGFGTHEGGDTTSGKRTSGQHQKSQTDSLQSGDTVNAGYDVSQRVGVSRTAGDRTAQNTNLAAVGSAALGGKRAGRPLAVR
jgi:conjugal transfer mating pair stabilization protein TraG